MKNIFSHPLMQIASFFIVLVNGKQWGAMPYGWYISFGTATGQPFAIIGTIAVLLAFASIAWRRNYLQPLSLILMWCSIAVFFWQLTESHKHIVFKGGPGLVTGLFFIAVSAMVFKERLSWKNF